VTRRVVFLHTVPSLVGLFTDLSKELLPGDVEIIHIADELLLKVVLAQGGLSPFIHRRVAEHAAAAEQAGAIALQCTCSSISPCVDSARPLVNIPVLKIDQPMVDRAIQIGSRVGVAATAPTTLGPTSDLVRSRAAAQGLAVQVDPVLCEGAYTALFAGDMAAHDAIVLKYLADLKRRNDVVILAQASMARLTSSLPDDRAEAPVLASPRLAVECLREVIGEQ
jgi:Asp/Glu/hydantoin racemase